MKILVCIKQVPDDDIAVVPDESGTCWRAAEWADWRINRYDEHALEEALRIREAMPGTRIDTVSAGPRASGRPCAAPWRWAPMKVTTSVSTMTGTRCPRRYPPPGRLGGGRGYDLILAGSLSEDDMHGQTGPMLAAHLDWPWAPRQSAWTSAGGAGRHGRPVHRRGKGNGGRDKGGPGDPPSGAGCGTVRNQPPPLSGPVARTPGPLPGAHGNPGRHPSRSANPGTFPSGFGPPPASCLFLEGTMEEKAGELLRILHDRSLL